MSPIPGFYWAEADLPTGAKQFKGVHLNGTGTDRYGFTYAANSSLPGANGLGTANSARVRGFVRFEIAMQTFEVRFVDYNGKLIEAQHVELGSDAIPPANPARVGNEFNGWGKDFTNVTDDIIITAQYSPVPTVIITGPDSIYLTDATATYGFSLMNMPEHVSAIELTFQVEDGYFFGQSLNTGAGLGILQESGWIADVTGDFWTKKLTLTYGGGITVGDSDLLTVILENRYAEGFTEGSIIDITAATPGELIHVVISGAALTESVAFKIYDVNRDGKVDLVDIAVAAYFFMGNDTDDDWSELTRFGDLYVSPKRCDVNRDGVVDIEDLIEILANFD